MNYEESRACADFSVKKGHLVDTSYSTWTSYRQTEPLRWTRYLDECLSVLAEGTETDLDILLVTQTKCQIIANSLTCSQSDEPAESEHFNGPSPVLMAAMKGRLSDIKQSLSPKARSESETLLSQRRFFSCFDISKKTDLHQGHRNSTYTVQRPQFSSASSAESRIQTTAPAPLISAASKIYSQS